MADTGGPTFRSPVRATPGGTLGGTLGGNMGGAPLSVADHTDTAKVVVRAGADGATAQALGVRFARARRLTRADGSEWLVVGSRPGEWMVIAGRDQVAAIRGELPPDPAATVVDLTHGRALLRVTGTLSARLLAGLCNVDLSDDMTPDLAAFSGSVAGVMCDLVRDDMAGVRSYLICVDRSYGGWLAEVLVDAAARIRQHER